MKVSVTRKHIDNAACGAAQKCMVALAIRQADPSIKYVAVRTNGITISRKRITQQMMGLHVAQAKREVDAVCRRVSAQIDHIVATHGERK